MEGGIDEAGRGPVLGPLVVAGVAVPDPSVLWDLGCRDSKALSPPQRQRLARLIRDVPEVRIETGILAPAELDRRMESQGLNAIEADLFIDVGRRLGSPRLVVDAADVDAARFGRRIAAGVAGTEVVSRHKADADHGGVAAASIIAKTLRDDAVAELAKRLERRLPMPLGSGYPSDPLTVAFLEAWLARFGDLPEGCRRSWKTSKRLLAARTTSSLRDFGAS